MLTGKTVDVDGKRYVEYRYARTDEPKIQVLRWRILAARWYEPGIMVRVGYTGLWYSQQPNSQGFYLEANCGDGSTQAEYTGTIDIPRPKAPRAKSITWKYGEWRVEMTREVRRIAPDVWKV